VSGCDGHRLTCCLLSSHYGYAVGSDEATAPLLRGEIIFDEKAKSFDGATLYLSLDDTTLEDAPAQPIIRHIIRDVSYNADSRKSLTFELRGQVPNERAKLTLNVLVDLDGDGKMSRGDYINMESYPVVTRGNPNVIAVRVKQIA
jgi:uncharacterized lipoprotein YbaY